MLKEVGENESLDDKKLRQFLFQKNLISNPEIELKISQFSNGYSNLTYLLDLENQSFVLRMPPKGAVKRGHDMSREFKVLSALQNGFNQSPKVYAYCDDNDIIGASFYIMERIEGIILTAKEAYKRKVLPEDFKSIASTWLDLFVDLHNLNYKSLGLSDLGKPDGYVARQVKTWSKQYYKAATLEIPEADFVVQWMDANQPSHYDHTFIHNDYKYDNVVFKNTDWKEISAILDWEMCTLGDPLMDLGTSLAYWMMPSDGLGSQIIPSPTMMEGNPSREELLNKYANQSNRNVDNFIFYYVYGLFKIAVIVQQIFYRYKLGLTKDEKFAQLDKVCVTFCKMAKQAILKNRIQNYM